MKTMIESPLVEVCKARLKQFLEENPRAKSRQEEINRMLATTLDPVERLEILKTLMQSNVAFIDAILAGVKKVCTDSTKKKDKDQL